MARHLTKEERIKYMRYDNAISMRPALECSYNYCKACVEGEMEIEGQVKMQNKLMTKEEAIEVHAKTQENSMVEYYSETKAKSKLFIEGLEALGLIEFKEADVGLPIGFSFPMSKRNEWTECVNELRKQGFKITK